MSKHILVVDDHEPILRLFERVLSKRNIKVTTCTNGDDARHHINKELFDVIISDLDLNQTNGLELLEHSQQFPYYTPFILITGKGTIEIAVQAVKSGAYDFIIKPFTVEQMLKVIDDALEEVELRRGDSPTLYTGKEKEAAFQNIIAKSQKMKEVLNLIERVACTSATVLIEGESGTGKELIAKAIHSLSTRKNGPFVAINCAALSENLLENELFGHVKGAFTGATNLKHGLFKVADKGTLFLDEAGDIPPTVQTKLLRVLQEKEFIPLGGNKTEKVDVRVIAATNANLQKAVKEKRFRDDLYYRLAVIPMKLPPLRHRPEDISILAMHFVKKYSAINQKEIVSITAEALDKLKSHKWHGNVRELENTIERAVALAPSNKITPDLFQHFSNFSYPEEEEEAQQEQAQSTSSLFPDMNDLSLKEIVNKVTKDAIVVALEKAEGNRSRAASILGIARASLYHKLKEYGIEEYGVNNELRNFFFSLHIKKF